VTHLVHHDNDYGMPSSHAQFMAFFTIYFGGLVLRNFHFRYFLTRHIIFLIVLISSIMVCLSRVYLGYHSREQVLIGSAIGMIVGILWYSIADPITVKYLFPSIKNNPIVKFCLIRDSSSVKDIIRFEYVNVFNSSQNIEGKNKVENANDENNNLIQEKSN